jgi:hypothetical protein
MSHTPSLRAQAIAYITKKRDAEMAIAGVYGDDPRDREIAAWHVSEAGALQFVLDALEGRDDGAPGDAQ